MKAVGTDRAIVFHMLHKFRWWYIVNKNVNSSPSFLHKFYFLLHLPLNVIILASGVYTAKCGSCFFNIYSPFCCNDVGILSLWFSIIKTHYINLKNFYSLQIPVWFYEPALLSFSVLKFSSFLRVFKFPNIFLFASGWNFKKFYKNKENENNFTSPAWKLYSALLFRTRTCVWHIHFHIFFLLFVFFNFEKFYFLIIKKKRASLVSMGKPLWFSPENYPPVTQPIFHIVFYGLVFGDSS